MHVVLDDNKMKASALEVPVNGIIPDVAVVKNVRISNVMDAEEKRRIKLK